MKGMQLVDMAHHKAEKHHHPQNTACSKARRLHLNFKPRQTSMPHHSRGGSKQNTETPPQSPHENILRTSNISSADTGSMHTVH